MLLLLSGCSTSKNTDPASQKGSSYTLSAKNPAEVLNKKYSHAHASNPCTAAVAHSHVFEDREHEHRYDCESSNKIVINGHRHPATAKTRLYRHIHPNGSNTHSHNK